MNLIKHFIKFWLPPIFYAILIFWFSSLEEPFGLKFAEDNLDKLLHMLEYGIFGYLLMRAVHGSDKTMSWKIGILISFIIGTFYGFTDELHQSVVPGRFATVSDFLFDTLGVILGSLVYRKSAKD
ncbi:MAG: VanZ family protein [Candidatus Omnitrophica bacterium]|nr:VanZ family protein [Candidatus Omnitrophota bacterium]